MRFLVLAVLLAGCSSTPVDPSVEAVKSGDLTLVLSACENVPARGMDICRVKEGAEIKSAWRLVVPMGKQFSGGELTVYYKDVQKTYPILTQVVEIPWIDLLGGKVWRSDMHGEALALAIIRWTDDAGTERLLKARGIAKLIVTKAGYDPMPLDSAFSAWGTECEIQYSTAGRSAISCQ